jgi:hypothetical protein
MGALQNVRTPQPPAAAGLAVEQTGIRPAVEPQILLGISVVEAQLSDQECITLYAIHHAMLIGYSA